MSSWQEITAVKIGRAFALGGVFAQLRVCDLLALLLACPLRRCVANIGDTAMERDRIDNVLGCTGGHVACFLA